MATSQRFLTRTSWESRKVVNKYAQEVSSLALRVLRVCVCHLCVGGREGAGSRARPIPSRLDASAGQGRVTSVERGGMPFQMSAPLCRAVLRVTQGAARALHGMWNTASRALFLRGHAAVRVCMPSHRTSDRFGAKVPAWLPHVRVAGSPYVTACQGWRLAAGCKAKAAACSP